MLILKKAPLIECDVCHKKFYPGEAAFEEYDYSDKFESSMGYKIEYDFDADVFCPVCGHEIEIKIAVYEYPVNVIEMGPDTKCNGGEVKEEPVVEGDAEEYEYFLESDDGDKMIPLSSDMIKIGIAGKEGKILDFPNRNFTFENSRISIRNRSTGTELFKILYDDLGFIKRDKDQFVMRRKFRLDDIIQLLGFVAEGLIVERCDQSFECNKRWLNIASRRTKQDVAQMSSMFTAVGTGHDRTRREIPSVYNPCDTQRDIIWVNKKNLHKALMAGSTEFGGNEAGIQSKVSENGMNYIYKDIINKKYAVPLVYFDLNNDFDDVYKACEKYFGYEYYDLICLSGRFYRALNVDAGADQELRNFFPLVKQLLTNQINPNQLIDMVQENYDDFYFGALMASAFQSVGLNPWILPENSYNMLS